VRQRVGREPAAAAEDRSGLGGPLRRRQVGLAGNQGPCRGDELAALKVEAPLGAVLSDLAADYLPTSA
jgi:hypothetical protein